MMEKKVLLLLAGVAAAGAGAWFFLGGGGGGEATECGRICAAAENACPSMIVFGDCESKCLRLSAEAKAHLEQADSCEKLASRPDLIVDLIVPEMNAPKLPENNQNSDCEAACGSYVMKCLTLVPNATEALFQDGLNSCMEECAGWNAGKVDCMINAFDCEAMTDVCGL